MLQTQADVIVNDLTDLILSRPSLGVTVLMTFPLTGILTTGNSLGVAGGGMPIFIFLDTLFDPGSQKRNIDVMNPLSRYENDIPPPEEGGEDEGADEWMSWEDQQEWVLTWVEERLGHYGLNGRECGLRFVCELERKIISHSSLTGELLSVFFT
ncbi:hypothetical protein SK128_002864, partial [Halocaridina rubra]